MPSAKVEYDPTTLLFRDLEVVSSMREEDQLASFQRLEESRHEFLVKAFSVPRLLVQHRDFLSEIERHGRHGSITLSKYLDRFKDQSVESLTKISDELDQAILKLGDELIAATLKPSKETLLARDLAIRDAANIAAQVPPFHITRLVRETRAYGCAGDGSGSSGENVYRAYCAVLPRELVKSARGVYESLRRLPENPESIAGCCMKIERFLKHPQFQRLLNDSYRDMREASQRARLYIVGRLLCAAAVVPTGDGESWDSESIAGVAPVRRVFEELREEAILKNWQLVVTASKRLGGGISRAAVLSAGLAGLCKAVDRYSTARGNQFSTFACWEIRGEISRERSLKATNRSPMSLERQTFDAVDPREFRGGNISCRLGDSDEQQLVAESFPTLLRNILPTSGQTGEEAAEANEQLERVRALIAELPERHATVLRLRHGIVDGEKRTLAFVGKFLGVSKERARQLETKAHNQIQALAMSLGLDEFLE